MTGPAGKITTKNLGLPSAATKEMTHHFLQSLSPTSSNGGLVASVVGERDEVRSTQKFGPLLLRSARSRKMKEGRKRLPAAVVRASQARSLLPRIEQPRPGLSEYGV